MSGQLSWLAQRAQAPQTLNSGHVQETRAFAEAQTLDQHKALIHIFFAQRSTKRVSGVTDAGLKPRPIKRVCQHHLAWYAAAMRTRMQAAQAALMLHDQLHSGAVERNA